MTDLNITVRPAVATDSAGVEHGIVALLAPEITRLEVGLPSPSFRHVKSTQSFYERVGFEMMGYRAKRLIP